jgi:hypothetical protein
LVIAVAPDEDGAVKATEISWLFPVTEVIVGAEANVSVVAVIETVSVADPVAVPSEAVTEKVSDASVSSALIAASFGEKVNSPPLVTAIEP